MCVYLWLNVCQSVGRVGWIGDTKYYNSVLCSNKGSASWAPNLVLIIAPWKCCNKYAWPLLLQTLAAFEKEYSRRAMEGSFDTVDVRFRIYDALWALAMALNGTMTMVNDSNISETGCEAMNGSLVPLEKFTYDNALMGCLIQWNLQRTNFFGVSVRQQSDECLKP